MSVLTFAPLLSAIMQIGRTPGQVPWQVLLRTTGYSLRPPSPRPYAARNTTRQQPLLESGACGLHQRAEILCEERFGPIPTIVIGGFVPDATEAAYLLRGTLLRQGSVLYVNYPRRGFSIDLFVAQIDDLVTELATLRGRPPVVIAVSFGAGIVLEWLRRAADAGRMPALSGLVLVSPVACAADLLAPGSAKPTTLLGRALKPYLQVDSVLDDAQVEKSRMLFLRMFEAGSKNLAAVRRIMAPSECRLLRDRVLGNINAVDTRGAVERVGALRDLPPLRDPRPLHTAPTLVLYAEKEGSVLCEDAPTMRELTTRPAAWFPTGRTEVLKNTPENPVQHASLIFHSPNFRPALAGFYRSLRQKRRQAA